jgi:hypothetical protein
MATPLRKDQPEVEKDQVTTADLALGKPLASEVHGPEPVASQPGNPLTTPARDDARLFPSEQLEVLRTRWTRVQTAFVDEPRKAVEQADGLVASAMKQLAAVFAEERSRLERQWDQGDNISTEELRVALQRYRTFFDRLLSV